MSQNAKRLLVAGGDLRQLTAAESLSTSGQVTVTGFDRFGALPDCLTAAEHIQDLPHMLDALILPMPVTQDGCFLYTPFGSNALRFSALLPLVRPEGIVLGGRAARDQAEGCGGQARELEEVTTGDRAVGCGGCAGKGTSHGKPLFSRCRGTPSAWHNRRGPTPLPLATQ